MKKISTLILICLTLIAKADYWTQKANFPGPGRQVSSAFVIGNKGYVSCGLTSVNTYLNDLWEYDPATNVWTQKANLPAAGRFGAVGFSIYNKGYITTGEGNSFSFDDLWEYDAVADSWTSKANLPGAPRSRAAGFTIGNKGYISCGESPFLGELWEWDQATNVWSQKSSLSIVRVAPGGFSINVKGYVSTGANGTGSLNDLWEYDTLLNTWTQKANLPAPARFDASAFTICGKGYLGTGGEAPYYDDFWQYDPALNQWIQKTNVPGGLRDDCAAFSIGSKGYLGLGQLLGSVYLLDLWEYTPDSVCTTGIEEQSSIFNFQFSISPNPAIDLIVISYPLSGKENLKITITDVNGKIVLTQPANLQSSILNIQSLKSGIYFVTIDNGKEKAVKKFVKE